MRFIFVAIFLLFSVEVFSSEAQGILQTASGKLENVKEGDSFVADLILWPMSSMANGDFAKLYTNKKILNFFHVSEVINEGFSENNPEAYKVKLRLILTKFFDNRNFIIFSHRALNIPVTIKLINPIPLEGRAQQFVFLEQDYKLKEKSNLKYYLIFALILLISAGLMINKRRNKNIAKREYLRIKTFWLTKFNEAESRADFETIYKERKAWEKYIDSLTPEIIQFYNTLNRYQFKKEWVEEECHEVKESFDSIRNILA